MQKLIINIKNKYARIGKFWRPCAMSGMNVVVKISRILVLVLFCLLLASNLSCHINDNHDNDDRDNLILLVLLYLFSGTNPASNPEGSLVDTVEDGAAKTNYIFSNVNFGTAASDRLLVIFVNGQRDVGGVINSASVGGVSATLAQNDSRTDGSIATIIAAVPAGTAGDVAINWSILQQGSAIQVYRLSNLSSTTPIISIHDEISPLTQTISYEANSVIMAHAKMWNAASAPTFLWSGSANLNELVDTKLTGSNQAYSSAMRIMDSPGSGAVVTASSSGGSAPVMNIIGFK